MCYRGGKIIPSLTGIWILIFCEKFGIMPLTHEARARMEMGVRRLRLSGCYLCLALRRSARFLSVGGRNGEESARGCASMAFWIITSACSGVSPFWW